VQRYAEDLANDAHVVGFHLERVIRDQTMPVARLTRFHRRHWTQVEIGVLKEVGGEKRTGSSD
jgi:hypothetical protein